jgi:hypothetical protein
MAQAVGLSAFRGTVALMQRAVIVAFHAFEQLVTGPNIFWHRMLSASNRRAD